MRARGLFANSAFALTGDLISKGATAATMILAARELSVGQLALLASALAAASVVSAGLDMGAQLLLTRDGVDGPAERSALLRSLLLARLPAVLVSLCAAGLLGLILGHLVLALLTVVYAGLAACQMLLSGALRSAQNLMPEAVLKLIGGALTVVACALCVVVSAETVTFMAALCLALGLTVTAAIPATARVLEGGHPVAVLAALRSSLPLGVMTLVTLIYYRSGTLALKLLSSPAQTARFATASTIGFALLMMPNAITTGLLPRLAATSRSRQPALVRRAVVAALMICATAGSSVALTAHPLLELLFGATYGQAAPALRVLALATILIGPTGVLGTALIAQGHLRPVYLQVGASLVVNLVVLAWLGPRHGAVGAALATLMCETLAFVVTGVACVRACPELLMPNSQGGWAGATKPGVS